MSDFVGLITIDERGRAVLPAAVRREMRLTEGSQLRVERSADGSYELVPVETIPRDQLYFYAQEMQERIERAERSFRDGTSTRTEGEAETQRFLDELKQR